MVSNAPSLSCGETFFNVNIEENGFKSNSVEKRYLSGGMYAKGILFERFSPLIIDIFPYKLIELVNLYLNSDSKP